VLRAHLATARSAGVVHSFDGDAAELAALLDLGMSIGINGCSMRAEPNLRIAASVPLDRLLIETDAPWCQVRPTHAGHASVATQFPEVKKEAWRSDSCVKSRNEPCHTLQVLEILAAARGEPISELGAAVYANARRLFYKDD
jgi:TatD DNase family protein